MTMTVPGKFPQPLRCIVSQQGKINPAHPIFSKTGGAIHLLMTGDSAVVSPSPSPMIVHRQPLREFLHVDDLASGILHLLQLPDPPDLVNIGSGEEISIRGVAELIAGVVGFRGKIVNDLSMPDGTPRKLSDISLIKSTGWSPHISLRVGLTQAYQDFLRELKQERLRSV